MGCVKNAGYTGQNTGYTAVKVHQHQAIVIRATPEAPEVQTQWRLQDSKLVIPLTYIYINIFVNTLKISV